MASRATFLRVGIASDRLLRLTSGSRSRPFSALSSFASTPGDSVAFPRVARGLDIDLNWSLAADSLTTRGEAYRNAPVRSLLEFAGPRDAVQVTRERALVVRGDGAGVGSGAPAGGAFATDVVPGRTVMDVEEFEGRLSSLRDECLSFAPRLFVEDASVGTTRESEVRVRVVTDSPAVALFFRDILPRTPLYAAEAFPRTLTVLAATLAAPEGVAAARGKSGPFTVLDVDPLQARGTVLAVGACAPEAIADAVAAAAGQLMALGGYRHVPGGAQNASISAAREDGSLAWYLRDGHTYADKSAPHPDLLALRNADAVFEAGAAGGVALVLGAPAGVVAGTAAAAGRLFAAHSVVWGAAGLSAMWSGLSVPAALQQQHAKALPLVRGSLVAGGRVMLPLAGAARAAPSPTRVIVVGAPDARTASGLTDKQAEKLASRMAAGAQVVKVADAAEAMKLLGLA